MHRRSRAPRASLGSVLLCWLKRSTTGTSLLVFAEKTRLKQSVKADRAAERHATPRRHEAPSQDEAFRPWSECQPDYRVTFAPKLEVWSLSDDRHVFRLSFYQLCCLATLLPTVTSLVIFIRDEQKTITPCRPNWQHDLGANQDQKYRHACQILTFEVSFKHDLSSSDQLILS